MSKKDEDGVDSWMQGLKLPAQQLATILIRNRINRESNESVCLDTHPISVATQVKPVTSGKRNVNDCAFTESQM